jgi:hypothetical protein
MLNRKHKSKTSKKILVVGYNNCLFTLYGTHPKFLSNPLLEFAKQGQFFGFYGCTHIAKVKLKDLQENKESKITDTSHTLDELKECYKTYQITENFLEAAELDCFGVSTIDDLAMNLPLSKDGVPVKDLSESAFNDLIFSECGKAYYDSIKPYEFFNDEPYPNETLTLTEFFQNSKNKNVQLIQIARHASEYCLGEDIELHFVDDSKKVCEQAFEAVKHEFWPPNVKLFIFHHRAENDQSPVIPIATVADLDSVPSPINRNKKDKKISFFIPKTDSKQEAAAPAKSHGMETRSMTREQNNKDMKPR